MRLVSFDVQGLIGRSVRLGALDQEGFIVDLQASYYHRLIASGLPSSAATRLSTAFIPADMVDFIRGGEWSLQAAQDALDWASGSSGDQFRPDPAHLTMLAPIPQPPLLRDFMAFETHLQNIYPKLDREIPPEWYQMPVYYKANTASVGAHNQDIVIPSYADELDFEFELGLVISRDGTDIPKEQALEYVYGLMIYNDFSARGIQSREMSVGLGPAKGKDFRSGHVFGPSLVTIDEIPDLYDLHMTARVNGETWCDSNSGTIHWRFEDMISHASMGECIRAGEVLGSGTVGNGSGAERGKFLAPGDVVELEVDHLGTLRNRIMESSS